ncbi:MAG: solute:sodium symporter family transporter, partial [Planctomycetota bacterium]
MDTAITLGSFAFFTGLVGFFTWRLTRGHLDDSSDNYFLAGRSLSAGVIAGSLMLTNLSTEQLVGLNGDALRDGLSCIVWEVVASVAIVLMALCFLPFYLRTGIATVPQFFGERIGPSVRATTSLLFITAYTLILLPVTLYSGARGLVGILDMKGLLGIESEFAAVAIAVVLIGSIGSVYAIFGGLKSVAVSDTLNGLGLLVGGFLISYYALMKVDPA